MPSYCRRLFFFVTMTLSGNTGNFDSMMSTGYTKQARKRFSKLFLYRSYRTSQDRFYDHDFYNDYEFVKGNIGKTSDIAVSIFNKLSLAIFNVVLSVIAITLFDYYIVMAIALLSAALAMLNRSIVKRRVSLNRKYIADERKADYYKGLLTSRAHAKELRLFRLQDEFIGRWERHFRKFASAQFVFEVKAALLNGIVAVFDKVMPACFSIYYVYLVSAGKLTAGDAVFLTSIIWTLSWGINSVIDVVTRDINESYQYADKYLDFVGDFQPFDTNAIDALQFAPPTLACGSFEELQLQNIRYKYPYGEEYAVKNVDFRIQKGEIVSILGFNGSGKTTLSKIACGLLDAYEGTVRLNGRDIKELSKDELSPYFGVGFQDFARYSVSLRDNVAVGMIEKADSRHEIDKAIEKGNLDEVISKLPKGAETILGKEYDREGQDLSGGQWQRIILSRAYMGEPEILILDEPTASVDPIEEMRMLAHFKNIVLGKTAILISHRIGFAKLSDRICVMDQGTIVEEGTHAELMSRKGTYYELFTAQQSLYTGEGNRAEAIVGE